MYSEILLPGVVEYGMGKIDDGIPAVPSPNLSNGPSCSSLSNFDVNIDLLSCEVDTGGTIFEEWSKPLAAKSGNGVDQSLAHCESGLPWEDLLPSMDRPSFQGNGPHLLELPLEPTVPWLVESTMLTCSQDTSGEHSAMNGESRHSNLKKRPGRPQLYDLDVQLNDIPVADSGSEDSHCKKKARGPKPKYVYSSAEQAAAARRQRNRKTALESYYRRREKIQNLEKEVSQLEQENKRLCQLLDEVNAGTATVHECADIDAYLEKTSD